MSLDIRRLPMRPRFHSMHLSWLTSPTKLPNSAFYKASAPRCTGSPFVEISTNHTPVALTCSAEDLEKWLAACSHHDYSGIPANGTATRVIGSTGSPSPVMVPAYAIPAEVLAYATDLAHSFMTGPSASLLLQVLPHWPHQA